MGIGPAVATLLGNDANSVCFLDPLLGGEGKTVESRQLFKPVEFDGFKIRVIQEFPYAQKLDGIAVPDPIPDQIVGSV